MGVPRYGISLRLFNSIRVIPYLQATTYYFVYHINAIALYWEEKPTSFMHENKWPDNPRITIIECVGAHPEDGKVRWIVITKTTMIVIFNLQNSHLLTLSILTKEVFQLNGQNRPMANLAIVDFHSQPREMPTPKPYEYVTFGFFLKIGFLLLLKKFEPHRLSAIRSF